MIALDTNVLIRLLVDDDPIQAKRARRLLESTRERGEQCFISAPVLCEIEWVLDLFSRGKGDFSDYLLGVRSQKQGARTTYTYDRKLRDEEGFTLLR